MENSNSKQVLLSIIGIAILIIAVVGVSFAFFTYSKTGEKNNVITTGTIEFSFNDAENNVVIQNQFPKNAEEGISNSSFNFSVTGNVPEGTEAIKYEVYALAGLEPTDESIDTPKPTKRFQDSDIKLYLTGRDATTGVEVMDSPSDGITIEKNYGNIESGDTAGDSANGFKLASSTIPNDGKEHTHNYTLTMWVSDSVTISDTDYNKTYRASAVDEDKKNIPRTCGDNETKEQNGCIESNKEDEREVYSNLYYSLKIKVVAGDAIKEGV